MNDWLHVTEQGRTRTIPGDTTPAPGTAIARIDPDAIVRSAIDANTQAIGAYMRTITPMANAKGRSDAPARPSTPFSSEGELTARNRRFYVSLVAYVALAAVVCWGLVQLATLAGWVAPGWWLPSWLALTGIVALWLVHWTHAAELAHTPEGLARIDAESQAYATERDADGRHSVLTAVADAIRYKAESDAADAQARQLATSQYYGFTPAPVAPAAPERRFIARWQTDDEDAGMVTYSSALPVQPLPPAAPAAPERRIIAAPVQPDPACVEMLRIIDELYADCARRADDLVVMRLPWSQRGDWPAASKQKALAVLGQLDPPLLQAGSGGRWRLNRADWPPSIARSAVQRRWMRPD